MNYAILPREIAPVLHAARAPGAGDHCRGAVDADVNVGGDKTGILGVGILDRRDQRTAVPEFSSRSRPDEVVIVDALEETGIVQGHGVSRLFLQGHEFYRL